MTPWKAFLSGGLVCDSLPCWNIGPVIRQHIEHACRQSNTELNPHVWHLFDPSIGLLTRQPSAIHHIEPSLWDYDNSAASSGLASVQSPGHHTLALLTTSLSSVAGRSAAKPANWIDSVRGSHLNSATVSERFDKEFWNSWICWSHSCTVGSGMIKIGINCVFVL